MGVWFVVCSDELTLRVHCLEPYGAWGEIECSRYIVRWLLLLLLLGGSQVMYVVVVVG